MSSAVQTLTQVKARTMAIVVYGVHVQLLLTLPVPSVSYSTLSTPDLLEGVY
jgi:hypothetical protein